MTDPIFTPLRFRSLTVKNRVMRSSMVGRIDGYDGSGSQARISWDTRTARHGVGAVVSAHVPVHVRGRIMPNVAMLDRDDRIPFWRQLIESVHEYDCKYIVQLSHAGRLRDIAGVENLRGPGLSSTDRSDPVQGFRAKAMTEAEIREVIDQFGAAARRAREAGADGVETHSANGYLFTQFLSSTINDRTDRWGGSAENRARFLLEVIDAIRREAGRDFHLQVKLSVVDYANVLNPFTSRGSTLEDSVQVARWAIERGADAIVVSAGSFVPHPKMPPGDFPVNSAQRTYDTVGDEGERTFWNYVALKAPVLPHLFHWWWRRRRGASDVEGMHAPTAAALKRRLREDPRHDVPVLVTGGFQTASVVRGLLERGEVDGVTIARPLIANPDLVEQWRSGLDRPATPCSFCNACLIEALENPLGCYDERRFGGDRQRMIDEVMSVFQTTESHP